MQTYTPTPEDRANDHKIEKWKDRQREESRQAIVKQLEQKQKDRVHDCLERWHRHFTD